MGVNPGMVLTSFTRKPGRRLRNKSTRAIASHRHASNARHASSLRLGDLGVGRAAPAPGAARRRPRTCRRRSRTRRRARSRPGTDTAGGSSPSTPSSISRPAIASSTTIHSSNAERQVASRRRTSAGRQPSTRRPTSRGSPASRSTGSPSSASTASASASRSWPSRNSTVARVRQPGSRERALHRHLVHRDRGADHARADVRQVGELEQALHGAVLAVGTVQQRQHDVDVERAASRARPRRRPSNAARQRLGTAPRSPPAPSRPSSHRPSVVIATGTTS